MRIAQWGNSLAVRLPANLVQSKHLRPGDEVDIELRKRPASLPVLEALRELREFRGLLPTAFRFDREEANAR